MATIKQKILFTKISENIRQPDPNFTLGKTLLSVGYAPTVAEKPALVTQSKGFRELMEAAGLDDDSLTRAHTELLHQKRVNYFVFPKSMDNVEIKEHVNSVGIKLVTIRETDKGKMAFYYETDANARKAALDMAYKLKGNYAPEKTLTLHGHVVVTPKQQHIADKYAEELRQSLIE